MNKKYYEKARILIFFVGCFLFLVIHAFIRFESKFMDIELSQKKLELEKTAKIKAESIKEKHEEMVQSLTALGESVIEMKNPAKKDVVSELLLLAKVSYFDYVGISDVDGNFVDSVGYASDIRGRAYFEEAISGKISVSDVMASRVNGEEEVQIMAVPIQRGSKILGVVFGVMKVGNMDQFLENETGSDIYTQIMDSNGNYITTVQTKDSLIRNKNVWDDFEEFDFLDRSIEDIKDDIRNGRSDSFTFRMGDEERFSFYMPLGIKEHYIFSTVNSEYIKNRTAKINREILHMMSEVGIAFLILLIGLFWFNRLVKRELQASRAEAVSSAEIMRIAIRESEQLVFEYNKKTKTLWRKAGIKNELFLYEVVPNVPESVIAQGQIAEESVKDFREVFERISQEDTVERLIRFNSYKGVQWFRIIIKNIYDHNHQTLKIVGIVNDVTEKVLQKEMLEEGKKENAVLQKRAERDELTGLYNAATVKSKIQEFLDSSKGKEGTHLFLLMDLDNFKKINDTFGHQFGDQVLKETAEILCRNFRRDDILGRLGGDEFIAFLTDATDFKTMEAVFTSLCRQMQRTYTKDGKSVTVSSSIGITETPRFGSTFRELYEKSDLMLYEVKRHEKNGYKEYRP